MIKSIGKSFGVLSILTIVEKLLSFVYQAFIASELGASFLTDSYFASSQLVTLIDATFFSGLIIVLLKHYTSVINETGEDSARGFLSKNYSWILLFSAIISLGILIFARSISMVIAPGFSPDARIYLIRDIRILSFTPLLYGGISIYSAILRQQQDFLAIGMKSLFLSVLGIAVLILIHITRDSDNLSLAYGQLIAIILYFLVIRAQGRKKGPIHLEPLKWGAEQKSVVSMLMPLIISNGITRVSMMIDRIIASNIGEGAVSYITYSHTLYDVVYTLIIANLSMILLSDFTTLVSQNDTERLKKRLTGSIVVIFYVLSVITIVAAVFHEDIVRIVYGRGQFSETAIIGTGGLLLCYSFCFVFSAVNNIYIQVFYSYGKTKLTMYVSLISMIINIISSVVLSHVIGLNGIAVGTIISTVTMSIIYAIVIRRQLTGYGGPSKSLVNCIIISAACLLISLLIKKNLNSLLLRFLLAALLCFTSSFALLLILKDPYTKTIQKSLWASAKLSVVKNSRR